MKIDFCLSSRKFEEAEFCLKCKETSNRCQRLTHKMMADNSRRNISLCTDIVDGTWTEWTDLEDCRGLQKVDGLRRFRCGEGYKTQQRKCDRTLGGKFCQIDGEDYKSKTEPRISECSGQKCPGQLINKNLNTKT